MWEEEEEEELKNSSEIAMTFSISETLPSNLRLVKLGISQRERGRACHPVARLNPNGQANKFSSVSSTLFVGVELVRRSTSVIVRASTTRQRRKKFYPGEDKGFVEEMRFVAMKLHSNRTVKQGEMEEEEKKEKEKQGEMEEEEKEKEEESDDDADSQPVGAWEPTIKSYLQFLVDSKLLYETLEAIVDRAPHSSYTEFRNTGLERSERLAKDLESFVQQGHAIPEPRSPGTTYSKYLEELAEKDPPAFICHFYNIYFAHTAGGLMIGRQVAKKILDGRELEFYKWDGDLLKMLKHVKEKLNKVAEGWSREEKNHCLEETGKSFKYSGKIIRLIIS